MNVTAMPAGHRIVVGIDASRNRSGGAKGHLVGILRDSDPRADGIDEVHVWSYASLLTALPERPWLIKHSASALERSLPHQLWWQWRHLPRLARQAGCQVLLNTDAGSICSFRPAVVMSRDMLSYEPGEIDRYRGKAWARLWALRHVQSRSLRMADGVIFLTRHAASVIQQHTGVLPRVAIIPHGVGSEYKEARVRPNWPTAGARPVRLLYVSNTAPYKHQWQVVRAVADLRRRGYDLQLELIGGGSGQAQRRLDAEIALSDPGGNFVTTVGFLPPHEMPARIAAADLFVFASSCENMPNTLVEAMAVGLPIACSDRGPMPEVLRDGGVTFDPESTVAIADAIERLLSSPSLRTRCATRASTLADEYSWARCGRETWQFLLHVAQG